MENARPRQDRVVQRLLRLLRLLELPVLLGAACTLDTSSLRGWAVDSGPDARNPPQLGTHGEARDAARGRLRGELVFTWGDAAPPDAVPPDAPPPEPDAPPPAPPPDAAPPEPDAPVLPPGSCSDSTCLTYECGMTGPYSLWCGESRTRVCWPPGCEAGRCLPEPDARPCARHADCADADVEGAAPHVCIPFVTAAGALDLRCGWRHLGGLRPSECTSGVAHCAEPGDANCTRCMGNESGWCSVYPFGVPDVPPPEQLCIRDLQCRNSWCLVEYSRCFFPCESDEDCAGAVVPLHCRTVADQLDGVRVTARACVP